ncbi:hypothetical protein LL251_17055 [Sphingobium naphthae]|nr:hypothetical protein [Sphingobium naphthae]
MTQVKVAIRLGTEGKEAVVNDFKRVGEAGDAAATRAARAFDRASQDIESAMRRQAAAADKIAAISPQTGMQARINMAVGTGASLDEGSARASALAFRELIAEQERYEAVAARIRAQLDPLWAAQQRYTVAVNEARQAHAAGALSADLLAQEELRLKAALDIVEQAHRGGNVSAGQYRAGMQQLGFQVQDLGVQMAMAAGSGDVMKGVLTGLAMQGPQVVSAIALMRGSAGGFLGFLAGPWGAGVMAATSVLAILGAQFLNSGDDAAKAVPKIDRYTDALRRLSAAQGAVTADTLGLGKVRVEQLRGQMRTLDQEIAASTGTRAAMQRRRQLEQQRAGLANELGNAEATVAGAQMAWDNRIKLDTLGRQDKASAAAARSAESAARKAERERQRNAERIAREEEQRALRVTTENNRWLNEQDIGGAARDALEKEGAQLAENQKLIAQIRTDTAAGTALLNLEWQIRGQSRDVTADTLELEKYRLDLISRYPSLTAEQVDELVKAQGAQIEMNRLLEDYGRDWQELQRYGENFIDTVLDPTGWQDFGDMGKAVLRDLAMEMWKLAAINPLKNALFGSDLPTVGGVGDLLGSLFKGASAIGHEYTPAGAMLVGENGPEIVQMPRGARVMTASDTRRAMGGTSVTAPPVYISIDATGADPAALGRVEDQLQQLRSELPGTIVSTVNEAQERLILRANY